jgi:hypothetical protein
VLVTANSVDKNRLRPRLIAFSPERINVKNKDPQPEPEVQAVGLRYIVVVEVN